MQVVGTTLKCLAVAFIFSLLTIEGTQYIATYSLFYSLVFGALMIVQAFTTIIWVISKDIY